MEYKLCQIGKSLFEIYCEAAETFGLDDPRTAAAWNEWMLHKRGDANQSGCAKCNGLKGEKNEESV